MSQDRPARSESQSGVASLESRVLRRVEPPPLISQTCNGPQNHIKYPRTRDSRLADSRLFRKWHSRSASSLLLTIRASFWKKQSSPFSTRAMNRWSTSSLTVAAPITASNHRRYEADLAYWVSEEDRGQVEAINKGMAHTTGEIVAFVNSDDVYLPGTFAAVMSYFETHRLANGCVATRSCSAWVTLPRSFTRWCRSLRHTVFRGRTRPRSQVISGDGSWSSSSDLMKSGPMILITICMCAPAGRTQVRVHSSAFAGYRLHPASKTVAENDGFNAEFERSAEVYEEQLDGSSRRWCRATRYLRRSYAASSSGHRSEGLRWLMRALVTYPEGLTDRPFWGCLRRLGTS